jgi:hypothetical protein
MMAEHGCLLFVLDTNHKNLPVIRFIRSTAVILADHLSRELDKDD